MSKRHLLLTMLKRVGTFTKLHSQETGKSLGEHLMNTYDDLKRLGVEEEVALAGGLHSIYGTKAFKHAAIKPENRHVISGLFGEKAERLAWLFGNINRPHCLEHGGIKNWKTDEPIEISDQDLEDLKVIEVVNLKDNGSTFQKYPNLKRFEEEWKVSA